MTRDENDLMRQLYNRLLNQLTRQPKNVRQIFSAFWGGDSEHAAATLVYFPRWMSCSLLVSSLIKKNAVSKWALDSAVYMACHLARQNDAFIIPHKEIVAAATRALEGYEPPVYVDRGFVPNMLTIEGFWDKTSGGPYHTQMHTVLSGLRFTQKFWETWGYAVIWEHFEGVVELSLLRGDGRSIPSILLHVQSSFKALLRKSLLSWREKRTSYIQRKETCVRALRRQNDWYKMNVATAQIYGLEHTSYADTEDAIYVLLNSLLIPPSTPLQLSETVPVQQAAKFTHLFRIPPVLLQRITQQAFPGVRLLRIACQKAYRVISPTDVLLAEAHFVCTSKGLTECWWWAVRGGHSLVVQKYAKLVARTEGLGGGGLMETALARAAELEDVDTMNVLIKEGANVDNDDVWFCVLSGGHLEALKLLLLNGANPNLEISREGDYDYGNDTRPLIGWVDSLASGSLEQIKVLIAAGADVNAGRHPPLWSAARTGNHRLVRCLLDGGASRGLDVAVKWLSHSLKEGNVSKRQKLAYLKTVLLLTDAGAPLVPWRFWDDSSEEGQSDSDSSDSGSEESESAAPEGDESSCDEE